MTKLLNFKNVDGDINKDVNALLKGFHTKSKHEQDITIRSVISHVAQISYKVGTITRNGVLFNMHQNVFQLYINDDPLAYIHYNELAGEFVSLAYNEDPNSHEVYAVTEPTKTIESQIIELSQVFMYIMSDIAEDNNFTQKFDVNSIKM